MLSVAPTTIKRWADEGVLSCVKTPGGHRRFRRFDVERLRRGAVPTDDQHEGGEPERWVALLTSELDERAVLAALMMERARHGSWWRVADSLGPVLDAIGRYWEQGRLTILQEHVASERMARALAACAAVLPTADQSPRCLLTSAEGDEHTLGLSLAELCVREAGWVPRWSGRATPSSEVTQAIESGVADMVAVSASAYSQDADALTRQASTLAASARAAGVALVFGGQGQWPEEPSYGHRFRTFEEFHRLLMRLAP